MSKRFVSYFRVSTKRQGESGLGLEAQREAVSRFVGEGQIVASFEEVESGGRADRPALRDALRACKLHSATLVIAKLDRLARNVHFISGLMESGVDFVAVDNPHATRLTINIMAAVAEEERRLISERTRAALSAARARGVQLGNPRGAETLASHGERARERSLVVRQDGARSHATLVHREIAALRAKGATSLREIASGLNALGVDTPRAGGSWSAGQVRRVLAHELAQ